MKKRYLYIGFMAVFAFFIALNFGIHAYRTNAFNKQSHTMANGAIDGDCSFILSPQNGNEISWTRTAELDGETIDLYACSFEGVFTNQSAIEVSDWKLRLDIESDCYLNSAWCGIMEIHQNVRENEKVQTLDLRALNTDEVELKYYESGDIYLFPLKAGDYLIYEPSSDAKELPISANSNTPGQAGIGIIFYWNQTKEFVTPAYQVDYSKHKGYLQGREAIICIATCILWILLYVIGVVVHITLVLSHKKTAIEQKTSAKMLDEMIRALASAIDAKDEYTHGHSERVAQYAFMLAKGLNLSNEMCKEIFYAGLVHDVGKIAIPEEIINKPGRLTDEEFMIIKSHPSRGEKILSTIEDMPYLAIGAKYHHERYDGFGYPEHVKGTEIPLLARIIAVADSYDAMTSQRSYRNTLNQRTVKQEIWKGIGTQFDPLVAKQMISLIDADVDYDMREKPDETYELIEEIKTNAYQKDYNPKSIKSEEKVMSDTSLKYFGEFVSTVEHWCNPVKVTEITNEESVVTFVSTTEEAAEYIWNVPIAIVYTSEDGEPVGKGYKELGVVMSAGYSWKTGEALYEENQLIRKEAFVDWNNWLSANKKGLTYRLHSKRENNELTLLFENDLLEVKYSVELPKKFNTPVYVCLSGENCTLNLSNQ